MQNRQTLTAPHFVLEYIENDELQTVSVPHCHDLYEVYCYFQGRVTCDVEGVKYPVQPMDILLLNRSVFHNMNACNEGNGYRRVIIHFEAELLHEDEQFLLSLFSGKRILYPNAWDKVQGLVQDLQDAAGLPETVRDVAIRATMVQILVRLYAMSKLAVGMQAEQESIQNVIAYINAHLTEPLTLDGLAKRFYISRNTLARQFRRATGTTAASYILYKRMALAQIFLRAGHPAGIAAQECGFQDYSTFYRSYQKIFGQSPADPIHVAWETQPSTLQAGISYDEDEE